MVEPYSRRVSKYLGEEAALHWNKVYGLPVNSIRIFNAYGPREAPDPDYAHVIPQLIDKVLQNQYPVKLYGTGNQTRTFTHGSDIARAFKLSLEKKSALNQIFNVSGDAELKIIHVLEKIWEFTSKRKKLRVKHLSPLKDDVQRRYPSNKKIKKILGWKPEVKFDDGLKETISWVQNNKYKN